MFSTKSELNYPIERFSLKNGKCFPLLKGSLWELDRSEFNAVMRSKSGRAFTTQVLGLEIIQALECLRGLGADPVRNADLNHGVEIARFSTS